MTQLCNITAALCSCIIRSCPDDALFVQYSCLTIRRRREMLTEIAVHVPPLIDTASTAEGQMPVIRSLTQEELRDDFYAALKGYIAALQEQKAYFGMIALAQVLDEAMKDLLLQKIRVYQSDDFSVVLNTNREETGIGLLPRCSCIWERQHRLIHSYNRLDSFLFHLLLIENTVLGELIDKHIFLPDDFFPAFSSRRQLTVAVSPLRREKHFTEEHYIRSDIHYLRIRYDDAKAAADNEAVWQKILSAAARHCDIVVFPEVLGNSETAAYIRQKLLRLSDEERKKMPSLMILPSVWENKMNTVTVLDRSGTIICRQSKQNPYRMVCGDMACLEDIRTNNVVSILHYEGIGRIAILICRDFLTTKYMEQLMRCFKLTLIIVPSYSTGSYDFCQSSDVCANDACNVIWINTCAAMKAGKEDNFKNIGYVRKRIGRNDSDSQKLCVMPVCGGAFSGHCSGDCIYFETIRGV